MGRRGIPQRQRADRVPAPRRLAGRRTSARIGSNAGGGFRCEEEARSIAPVCRLRSSSRRRDMCVSTLRVRMMLIIAAALVVIGIWGGIRVREARRDWPNGMSDCLRPSASSRPATWYSCASAATTTTTASSLTIGMRRRAGNCRDRQPCGAAEREKYAVGSPVAVWYLSTEPEASWLDGYSPRREASWPAAVVPLGCGVSAMALIFLVRRQSNLLALRPARHGHGHEGREKTI